MNLSQEQINEIKAAHPELWKEKSVAGLSPHIIASAILSQVQHDAQNPPEAEAQRRVNAAFALVIAAHQRYQTLGISAQAVYDEVRAQFPELELDLPLPLSSSGNGENAEQLIQGYRSQIEGYTSEIGRLDLELKAAQEKAQSSGGLDDLEKELLVKLRACSSIKEVREAFAAFDAASQPTA